MNLPLRQLARVGWLRIALCAAGVGLAPRFAGTPLPALTGEEIVSVEEPGDFFLLLDHRSRQSRDGPIYAELWRPLGPAELPLRGLVLIAPSASNRAPTFRIARLARLAEALTDRSSDRRLQPHR